MVALHQHTGRLRKDIGRLAGDIGERNIYRYPQLVAAAGLVEQWLREAGYAPARQEYEAKGRLFANLEAEVRGTTAPADVVIVGAHYDTHRGSPGANDNASGIAVLLALARAFAHGPVGRTLRFVAFANEERPFLRTKQMGSRVYAARCRERGEHVVGMICLETLAYRSERPGSQRLSLFGLLADAAVSFRRRASVPCETFTLPSTVPGAWSSYHWSFWKARYPAFMVTDTAPLRYPYYHKPGDTPEQLDYEFLAGVAEGVRGVVSDLVAQV